MCVVQILSVGGSLIKERKHFYFISHWPTNAIISTEYRCH